VSTTTTAATTTTTSSSSSSRRRRRRSGGGGDGRRSPHVLIPSPSGFISRRWIKTHKRSKPKYKG